jgi:hypothetical protein
MLIGPLHLFLDFCAIAAGLLVIGLSLSGLVLFWACMLGWAKGRN